MSKPSTPSIKTAVREICDLVGVGENDIKDSKKIYFYRSSHPAFHNSFMNALVAKDEVILDIRLSLKDALELLSWLKSKADTANDVHKT